MRVCLLAGGTGAARLAAGLQDRLAPGELTVIANTGDDLELWGLQISPDLDAVIYRLAGLFNRESGFGVAGDTFATLEMMMRFGEPGWFRLGDRDLATHILRSSLMAAGMRPAEAALELCRRLGLSSRVLPMSDQPVRTWFQTEAGRLSFQEYFVLHRCAPALSAVEFEGLDSAAPAAEAEAAVTEADLVVIGPSNPVISVGPILALLGARLRRERTLAVSPIVGGRSLKGPTVEMMAALGREPTPEGVAREYSALAAWYVLDVQDAKLAPAIEARGYRTLVTDTVMGENGAGPLASAILEFVAERA
jgi:LPPG:FO 2-phospho-L-lactate transferase